ncbi:chorismate-binding protein [Flagellimonas onchidii]|uniref:chorismate-binding protein n=1 Tax=Flagellimonas onchidii TaxID=2562684 RepID=UPI001F0FCC35|nr:chorismate-binding protein [Allomuricauda onchidii]
MPYPRIESFDVLATEVIGHLTDELPFVLYRKPGEKRVTGLFQNDSSLNFTFGFDEKGFVFAPFDTQNDAILLRADKIVFSEFEKSPKTSISEKEVTSSDKDAHQDLVQKGITEIKKGNLKKVVLSRKIETEVSTSHQKIFSNLLNSYPNAFCYWFHHPKVGMWCGATPETLVQVKDDNLRTMSLAATTKVVDNQLPLWGDKEMEEQQMVSDHIAGRLHSKLKSFEVGKAESVMAGSLWHLKSEITGELSKESNLREIIMALHPTPAVCGIPTESAKDFILKNENYQRKYYTGYLGELNLWGEQEIALYVNLRCMELGDGKASIFVGGGITMASDPQSEWVETQNKSKTMLSIL